MVTCRTVAMQWPLHGPFLGNGSVNTFQLLGGSFLIMQQFDYSNGRTVFFAWSVPKCYKQRKRSEISQPCVKAGSNTSTVALRVVGGDGKRKPVLGVITGPLCSWGI
jgi:hypothetical protein